MTNNFASILLSLLCVLGSFSCGNKHPKKDENPGKSIVVKKHNISLDYSVQQTLNFEPDTTINNILCLDNRKSSKQFYSRISSLKPIEFMRESPVLAFNSKNKEYLLLYIYEGGVENEFSCFEIGYLSDLETEIITTNTEYKSFETESGLKLGLSFKELIKIKGDSYIKEGDKIIYRIDDYTHSSFLKSYNEPEYFLECTLQNDKICKIKFGFVYP